MSDDNAISGSQLDEFVTRQEMMDAQEQDKNIGKLLQWKETSSGPKCHTKVLNLRVIVHSGKDLKLRMAS